MNPLYFFIIAIISIAVIAVAITVKEPIKYFKSKDGRGVLFGIVLALVAAILIALFAPKAKAFEYFSSGELFVGLDQTRKISPMCGTGPNSDRLTSNLGIRASLVRTDNSRAGINAKYTHHSCAVNPDKNGYDALGVEVIYRLW